MLLTCTLSSSGSAKPTRPRSQSASQASKPIILRRPQTQQGTAQGIAPMNFSPSSGSSALIGMTGIPGNLTAHCLAIVVILRGEGKEGGGRSLDVVRYFPRPLFLKFENENTKTTFPQTL